MSRIAEGIVRSSQREREGVLATHHRTLPTESANEIAGEKCRHPQRKAPGTREREKLTEMYVRQCGQGSQRDVGHFETVKGTTGHIIILGKVVNFADKITML